MKDKSSKYVRRWRSNERFATPCREVEPDDPARIIAKRIPVECSFSKGHHGGHSWKAPPPKAAP